MTTIAFNYKDKQVAVDSRVTRGDMIDRDNAIKSIKNDKGIWFFAGAEDDFADLMALSRNQKVDVKPDCSAILISEGLAFVVGTDAEGYCFHSELLANYAIGSGKPFAIASMDHGKSAKDAVKYAMTRDIYSGGRVRVFDVK